MHDTQQLPCTLFWSPEFTIAGPLWFPCSWAYTLPFCCLAWGLLQSRRNSFGLEKYSLGVEEVACKKTILKQERELVDKHHRETILGYILLASQKFRGDPNLCFQQQLHSKHSPNLPFSPSLPTLPDLSLHVSGSTSTSLYPTFTVLQGKSMKTSLNKYSLTNKQGPVSHQHILQRS